MVPSHQISLIPVSLIGPSVSESLREPDLYTLGDGHIAAGPPMSMSAKFLFSAMGGLLPCPL
jgi:hypothetical protein